jgi:hypothetical protein
MLDKNRVEKLILGRLFFEILFFKANVYLIDIVLSAIVCVLFFLLSPKTMPKTGVKTKANYHPRRGLSTPAPPCRAGRGTNSPLKIHK